MSTNSSSLDQRDESSSTKPEQKEPRRVFLKRLLRGSITLGAIGAGYTLFEAGWIRIHRTTIAVPRLPTPFHGTTVALLSDIHHGPFTSRQYVEHAVLLTNSLSPDVVLLGGDYVHRDRKYIGPCFQALSGLKPKFGAFGVLGNHDHWEGADETRQAMRGAGIVEMTNTGTWIEKSGSRLRLAGVGDLWEDAQDLDRALADTEE